MEKERKCIVCQGKLLKTVNDNVVSVIPTYDSNFVTGTYTDKYVCTECGYIQEYSKNPEAFTDERYRKVNDVNTASKKMV
ncbi:hypothetical protein SAMN02745248_00592 [Hathewaya proteolytica DSM 3090]|uniref:Uncharacterized protein n=1 Tax=Hathewaya proteolytica DSM 3090 TaxID=1121331 RepID=A0A1M6L237_9CLOT|nr:hypothetical protein [Hathewaya proteolytica]SHJ65206.1 hypothetical protein SAMN02745248_00592 [Hathewaya proteolytica DSM 3090]